MSQKNKNPLAVAKELLALLSFVLGVFRSTPEGRARRAEVRRIKAKEDHLKDRYKFIKKQKRDFEKGRIDQARYDQELADWDFHHPKPE